VLILVMVLQIGILRLKKGIRVTVISVPF